MKGQGYSEFFALEKEEIKEIEDLTLTKVGDQTSLQLK